MKNPVYSDAVSDNYSPEMKNKDCSLTSQSYGENHIKQENGWFVKYL